MNLRNILSILLLAFAGIAVADGGHRDTCHSFKPSNIQGKLFQEGNCKTIKGGYTVNVLINLDRCFSNENGHLKGKWKYAQLPYSYWRIIK